MEESSSLEMEESFSLSEVFSYCESETNIPDESEIDPRVGVVFHPTHEEAIQMLKYKSSNPDYKFQAIFEANIYDYEPYDLQGLGAIRHDGKFYFFCALKPLDDSGERFYRSTGTGYWKVTGKKFQITAKGTDNNIGRKRTLVFYKRFPGGKEERTNWVMQEYTATNIRQDFVVCKIKEKKEKVKKEDKKRRGRKEDKKQRERKEDKKRGISTNRENKRAKKRRVSSNDEGQSSNSVALDNPNHTQSPILSEQGSNGNYTESPILSEQGSNGNHTELPILPEQGSSSSSVSSIGNDVWNCLLGYSFSSQGFSVNHTEPLILLPEQGSSPSIVSSIENDVWNSLVGSNENHTQLPMLPEQGFSSSIFSSNEDDVWNSLGSKWDYSPQRSLPSMHESLQQIVFPLDELVHPGDEFLLPFLAEEAGHSTYISGVTST